MKRSSMSQQIQDPINGGIEIHSCMTKKIKPSEEATPTPTPASAPVVLLDENLLYEVLKHVDARTLGAASCVSKQWRHTAEDERLWELICTKHWTNMGCGHNQLRSVVLALGGFRRLHTHYLWPLSKPSISTTGRSSTASAWPCLPSSRTIGISSPNSPKTRWGKDEVQLSLSLLSIRYYEKMNGRNRNN